MLNAFASLKCSKKCWHNVQKPNCISTSVSRVRLFAKTKGVGVKTNQNCKIFLFLSGNHRKRYFKYRGYYMPARGYEFYLRVVNSISHE